MPTWSVHVLKVWCVPEVLDLLHEVIVHSVKSRVMILAQWVLLNTGVILVYLGNPKQNIEICELLTCSGRSSEEFYFLHHHFLC